jgi:fimbrial isopeptide formation D2 family protein
VTNSQPITVATNPANTVIANNGNQVTFNLGNVTNLNTSDAATNGLVITFRAVVLDVLTNQAGTNFQNAAVFTSGAFTTNVMDPGVQVVEPTLQVSEGVATNMLGAPGAFGLSVSNVQASDTVFYQMVITNSAGPNGTTAYDLWVSNSLPSGLLNPQVYSVTTAGAGNVHTNNVAVTGSLSPNLFSLTGNLLTVTPGDELDVDTNGALVVVVSAQLSYTNDPLTTLVDNTAIAWASVPGTPTNLSAYNPNANVRTGNSVSFAGVNTATNFSTNTGLLDNYAAVAGVVTIATVAAPEFAKTLVGTDHTAPGNGGAQVVIGEHVSYTLTVTAPHGTTPAVVITDSLPGNLAFVDVTNVTWTPNVTNSQPVTVGTNPANTVVSANGRVVVFNLGGVTNLNSNNLYSQGLSITFRAVVLDVLTNQTGTNLANTASFVWGSAPATNITTAAVTVVEPTLQVVERVSANPTNGFGAGVATLQAGDWVYYQMVITNSAGTNGTTAYDLWLSNSLPAGLQNPRVCSVTNAGVGGVYSNGVAVAGTLGTNLFSFTGNLLTVTPGDEVDLDTNGAITVVVAAQLSYTNNLVTTLADTTAIAWASLPGTQTNLSAYNANANMRTGNSVSFAGVNVAANFSTNSVLLDNYAAVAAVVTAATAPPNPTFAKALVGTAVTNPGNGNTNAVIGELVTYALALTVPQGLTTNAVMVDTLPTNLAFVDVTGVRWSANVTNSQPMTVATNPAYTTIANNGNQITFNLGNVTNLNTSDAATNGLAITFRAVVLDVLTNRAGTNFLNHATFTAGAFTTNVVSAGVQVVEPALRVSEQISGDNVTYGAFLISSNRVFYQLVITNSGGPHGTTAYDLWVSNSLPAGLINPTVVSVTNLGAGGIYTNGLSGTNRLSPALFGFNGNRLTVAGANEIDLDPNAAFAVVVGAQVGGVASPALPLTDATTITWSSLPGTQTNLSAYNPAARARTGASTPWPAPGVNNSTNNTLLDNYAAASSASLDYIPASIGNYVWNDDNADGLWQQPAEPGIPGVRVFVDLNGTGQYATNDPSAVTDANGYYLITNLLGGTYVVCVATNTLPVYYHETYSLVGGTAAPQESVPVVLTNGTTRLDVNFGYDYVSTTLATLQAGSFQGVPAAGGVLLSWNTLSEVGTFYYYVNRQPVGGTWSTVVPFVLAADSLTGGAYRAQDPTATPPGTYQYQLVEVQIDDTQNVLGYCTVVVGAAAGATGSPVTLVIGLAAGSLRLQWTGGTPPYHLYQTTALMPSAGSSEDAALVIEPTPGSWTEVPLSDDTTNTVVLPLQYPAAFFRVTSGQ